jgi:hypothetical protein
MTWKLRSKTAFTYQFGHHRYIAPQFKQVQWENINELPFIAVKSDVLSPVRIVHNYRNTSRAAKQFLLGDPVAEQMMLTLLRAEYLWPIKGIKSPIQNYIPIVSCHFRLIFKNIIILL